ncbi:TPA: DNA polymerase III subunit gamma/tau [Salmonella enterica subsp. enterica serovar Typhi str. AG3]|nr:DNA polymerase III subunit gamma/tau [Salmonella enterica subsp. enterica serovar Typhi str. AG3]
MTTLFENKQEANTQQHQALYRKYRPSGFEGLIGQDHVKTTLANALQQGTVSHAYLFTGPRGTGKTSTAKLFAKALNCENPMGYNPCGHCVSCRAEVSDIIELDAASNNSVDDIRQLRENVILAPMQGKYKIYILDEVHMLTTQAFNAFLKTLEEPPAHAIFILATTEVHKLPATILSRCQRFDFRRIPNSDIVSRLNFVLVQEGRTAEATALNLIAQVSAGGMRDSLSLLDQALSQKTNSNEVLTLEDVLSLTGAVDVRVIGKLVSLITRNKTEEALLHFNQCFASGKEPKFFVEEMMIYLRDILVFKKLGPNAVLKKANTDENFQAVASGVGVEQVFTYLDELQETLNNFKFHHDLQLLLEMSIIRMINGKQSSLQKQIDELRQMIGNGLVSTTVHESPSDEINTDDFVSPTLDMNRFELSQTTELPTFELPQTNVPEQTTDIQSFEETPVSSVPTFEVPKLDTSAFESTQVEVPQLINLEAEQVVTGENESEGINIDDPIGFIEIAKTAAENGIDWATQIPSEVDVVVETPMEEMISTPAVEPIMEEPGIPEFNPALINTGEVSNYDNVVVENGIMYTEPPYEDDNEVLYSVDESKVAKNVILSEIETNALNALSTANKQLKEQFNKVRELIINELGSLNLSTKSIFRDFKIVAVNEDTLILVHPNKVQVKLIGKVVHMNNLAEAFTSVYKPHKIIALTESEWNTVLAEFKSK